MSFYIKPIGTVKEPITEWTETDKKLRHYMSFSRTNNVMNLIKELKKGDKFVLYCTGRGFLGLQTVKSNYYENSKIDGPDWPYIVDVSTDLLVDFSKAIPISEIKQWANVSKLLSNALKFNLAKGLFEITEKDFQHFQKELKKKLSHGNNGF